MIGEENEWTIWEDYLDSKTIVTEKKLAGSGFYKIFHKIFSIREVHNKHLAYMQIPYDSFLTRIWVHLKNRRLKPKLKHDRSPTANMSHVNNSVQLCLWQTTDTTQCHPSTRGVFLHDGYGQSPRWDMWRHYQASLNSLACLLPYGDTVEVWRRRSCGVNSIWGGLGDRFNQSPPDCPFSQIEVWRWDEK